MRLCSVWEPEGRRPILCALGESGELRPLGRDRPLADVAELVLATGGLDGLEPASDALASWAEVEAAEPGPQRLHLLPPVRPAEVWAAGVTYERSRDARMHEAREPDIYERVYAAERPELFLKATGPRVVGPNARVGLRADSAWQVPEPELGLVLGARGTILGYTLGNDVSSRDVEGENPLYLPQAKIFAGSCSLGPTVVPAAELADPYRLEISLRIVRGGGVAFEAATTTARLHVRLETLAAYLARENWLALGTVLLTGTGIVPPDGFTLLPGDLVEIGCEEIGVLRNVCAPAAELAAPAGWTSST